ncbi:iron dicitrate transporter FecR [Fulvitalea axinellae]|uniref:Iron dicitrate transporter FecR n=1 Tax=Fulvitalea axinellae TaxID=1182444 RepID=A0AAU9D375_9BACT|nr:iron dicitrate transporter FecR [Fulvitalea axinellae]
MDKDNRFYDEAIRHLAGESTAEERQAFEEKICADGRKKEFERISQIWALTSPKNKNWDRIRNLVASKIRQQEPGFSFSEKTVIQMRTYWVAASLLLIMATVGAFFFLRTPMVKVTALAGEIKTVTLPDGSIVTLNSKSTLEYPKEFDKDTREVEIEGEGFFEVESNKKKPFIVHANRIDTKVLGTKFNVKAYKEDKTSAISLVEGQVQVTLHEGESHLLHPDQQIVLNKESSGTVIKRFDTQKVAGWKNRILVFDNIPLSEAIKRIERTYNVILETSSKEMLDCRISVTLNDETIETVMEILSFVTDGKIESTRQRRYKLIGKGC